MSQVDWSILGNLGNTYREAQQRAKRERTLADLGNMGGDIDYNAAALRFLANGDTQYASTLAQLGNNQRDFQFRKDESQRAQGNTDRAYELQKRTADEAARGYEYREVDGQNGKELVRIHKATGAVDRPQIAGQDSTPQNPYMTGGAMNEAQSKDALYATRMMRSEGILRSGSHGAATAFDGQKGGGYLQDGNLVPGPGGYGVEQSGTDASDRVRGVVSDRIGVNIRSPEHQKFDQAKRDFINATLRRESGAVISAQEFDNGNKQYFPMPGDTPELINQKRQNRMEAIRGIGAGGGRGYRPERAFDAQGNIVENAAPQRNAPAQQPSQPAVTTGPNKDVVAAARANPQAAVAEARDAIAKGADKNAVAARLKQLGIDPAGL